jgi:uncharacterized protein (DUF433 family)
MSSTASSAPSGTTDPLSEELVPSDSPLVPYVWVNPARMHGEPCFKGTRVPIKTLFDHLRAGDPIDEFLAGFPPVTREQVIGVIDLAALGLLQTLRLL